MLTLTKQYIIINWNLDIGINGIWVKGKFYIILFIVIVSVCLADSNDFS